ncbi:MAG: hypothetical protein JNJ52_01755 [Flavobacterium sp.]|nr:hypothetical protein [Flavobacterium sp.]
MAEEKKSIFSLFPNYESKNGNWLKEKKEKFFDSSDDDLNVKEKNDYLSVDQIKNKESINLLIVLELEGKRQFDRIYNNIWSIRHMSTFEDFENIIDLSKKYEYKNICLVHHGNIFSDTALGADKRSELTSERIKNITKVINSIDEKPIEINNDYVNKIKEKSKLYFQNGIKEIYIRSYLSLKLLIQNLKDDGCFFSVACNEADDENFLIEISNFNEKNIKLFANSNFSIIEDNSTIKVDSITFKPFKSILNSFLSSNWSDPSGWKYFDNKQKKIIITKKDLWLNSYGKSKIYELINRKKTLTKEQSDREDYAQKYFSIVFEKEFIKYYSQEKFKVWKKNVEKIYPEFKRP